MEAEEKNEYDFQSVENKWIQRWDRDVTYSVEIDADKPKFYALDTFIYPSANGAHVGHIKSFGGMDVMARYKRMQGFNVLYPGGWDTLGLPAENYAIQVGGHPREITDESIKSFRQQFRAFGLSYDWKREINTADPSYYRWSQWLFLFMYENGLAYRKKSAVNWCPNDQTVLAKEQVEDGKCERCGAEVEQRELMQWFFKVSEYADRLDADLSKLDWEEKYLKIHKNWIGKQEVDGETTFHVRDWCVSRQRYWGPPIPMVYCDDCGEVPVPMDHLPVVLPEIADFRPSGKSPLANDEAFINTTCPKCGGAATREADTLDTFVSSSWYQFRFEDPTSNKAFASKEAMEYWGSVDAYEGTVEHLTAHLIYARFVTKALYDKGLCPVDEPFPKYIPVGVLVDKADAKYSKRSGNAPNTNDLIREYGGDLLRLSCQFISPFGDISRWSVDDVVGVSKFRDRVWRVFVEKVLGQSAEASDHQSQAIHRLIRDVGENIETMKYNVALSKMMTYINELGAVESPVPQEIWSNFVRLLAPFAPFIAEEMWTQMGHTDSVHLSEWPEFDAQLVMSNTLNLAVQIGGKTRGTIEVAIGSTQEEVVGLVRQSEYADVIPREGDIYFVKDKVINFVQK